jgi:hypothetical protein
MPCSYSLVGDQFNFIRIWLWEGIQHPGDNDGVDFFVFWDWEDSLSGTTDEEQSPRDGNKNRNV